MDNFSLPLGCPSPRRLRHQSFIMHDAGEFSASAEAEIELQHREASWLEFELAHDHCKRQKKKHRRTGGRCFRQKSWRWIVQLVNMLNMTPFAAGGLRRFPVPEDWEQWAMIAWTGHACLCQPTKAQIRGALKHGWRVLAMVDPTWCENLMLTIMCAQRYPRYSQGPWLWELLVLANVALNIHVCHRMMVRSAGRSSKPLTPSGSSVGPHILSSSILQKSLVTRRACLDQRLHQTASNTLSGVGFWHPSLSTRADRKSVCASGSKCSCLCEGFFRRLDKLACGVHQGEFG